MLALTAFLLVCYAGAGLGGWLTRPGLPWLKTLRRPPLNPPNWLFGPVWTVLYGLMAVSGWWVYTAPPSDTRSVLLVLFALQWLLNVIWSGLFFYLRRPGWALIDVLALLLTIWAYILYAANALTPALWLFLPYGLWVTFATYLNAALWWLNRPIQSGPNPDQN